MGSGANGGGTTSGVGLDGEFVHLELVVIKPTFSYNFCVSCCSRSIVVLVLVFFGPSLLWELWLDARASDEKFNFRHDVVFLFHHGIFVPCVEEGVVGKASESGGGTQSVVSVLDILKVVRNRASKVVLKLSGVASGAAATSCMNPFSPDTRDGKVLIFFSICALMDHIGTCD
ncbi:hypothetical protein V6N12_065270 [Hibiscus sabdariffa]|uniref:Uncharacterized protein n=1 Tax=Hibiscus sabdariffa TaxID=183260 RepID=A0ABR2G870_9ROSI